MIDQMNLVKWNDFKKYQDPIPLKAKTLFKFCKQIKKKFLNEVRTSSYIHYLQKQI